MPLPHVPGARPRAAGPLLVIACVHAGCAVALGAFAAHALAGRLSPDLLQVFETAARYQMYHALAIALAVVAGDRLVSPVWAARAGWAFAVGALLFSGSLYLLALTGARWLGAITPFGGVAFLAGWVFLGAAAYGSARSHV